MSTKRHASDPRVGGAGASSRREFLAQAGLLALAGTLPSWILPGCGKSSATPDAGAPAPGLPAALLDSLLNLLAYDAMNAVLAFVVPGDDNYSIVQGYQPATGEYGGVLEDNLTNDLADGLPHNHFLALKVALDGRPPFERETLRAIVQSLAGDSIARGAMITVPAQAFGLDADLALSISDLLGAWLEQDQEQPDDAQSVLRIRPGTLVALDLHVLATLVDAASGGGPFVGPFANLSPAKIVEALAGFGASGPLLPLVEAGLPADTRPAASDLLATLRMDLLRVAGFIAYSEFANFDVLKGTLDLASPVRGWQAASYQQPDGLVHGWDVFSAHGAPVYYEGRKETL